MLLNTPAQLTVAHITEAVHHEEPHCVQQTQPGMDRVAHETRTEEDDACNLKNRKCYACQNAFGLRNRIVFLTDDDEDIRRWRKSGAEWMKVACGKKGG